jgi:hypothetical protein
VKIAVILIAAGEIVLLVWGHAPVFVTSLLATLGLYILIRSWGSTPTGRRRRR